jgi:RNA polymerase sigma-70 factor, ECF subfamily
MDTPGPGEVTALLLDWRGGDAAALERLVPLVYIELKRTARQCLRRERPEHTLQATALVNETYLRLVDSSRVQWNDRVHFFAVCAELMRRILVDAARERAARKRGGGATRVTLDETQLAAPENDPDLHDLDEALRELAALDERAARVVELKFFAGMTIEEIAGELQISGDTVKRDWRVAKAFLRQQLAARL